MFYLAGTKSVGRLRDGLRLNRVVTSDLSLVYGQMTVASCERSKWRARSADDNLSDPWLEIHPRVQMRIAFVKTKGDLEQGSANT